MSARHEPTVPFERYPPERQLACLTELAESALARYDLGSPAPPRLINLSENATFRIEDAASGRRWALRVHREGYHSRNAIASELAWAQALRTDAVVATPRPVFGRDSCLIQEVAHPALRRPRHVVLFEWESGEEPTQSGSLLSSFTALGEVAARMHMHSEGWARPPGFERLTWNFETSLGQTPHWGRWRDGLGLDRPKEKLFGEAVDLIRRRLAAFGQSPDRFGLIHSDMRLANLLIDDGEVKVIDFDDCGFSWRLYDAATAVSFFEDDPQVPELLSAWVEGYRRVRPLPAEDEAELPTFVMLRRLLLVAWIGSHSQTDLAQSMGASYTERTAGLCERYLRAFS